LTGTWLNAGAVLLGGGLGLAFGSKVPERLRQTVLLGLGLFTALVGVRLFLQTENLLFPLAAILMGGMLGEWWRIEDRLGGLGAWLEARVTESRPGAAGRSRFVQGFLTASLVFCVGPMTILGAIQDGLTGDYHLLAIKAALDGFAALAFASTLGAGVLFSVLVILAYQGGISLLAMQAQALLSPPMVAEMSAVGGVILLGISISSLLEIRPIRTANYLPALFLAPGLVWLAARFGLSG
jgi:uncharacterized membrane protein YqgA involved in biofilm formation